MILYGAELWKVGRGGREEEKREEKRVDAGRFLSDKAKYLT